VMMVDRMRTIGVAFAAAGLLLAPVPAELSAQAQGLPSTGAERANWQRASQHQEVLDFLDEIQKRSDRIVVEQLTTTNEGRPFVVAYLGDPPHPEPGAALLSGKPTVFIISSIHGNERSGREGGQQMIRELTLGAHQHLLEKVNVIIVPNMNPDGGDWGNNGRRTNSLGYDMNRDWVVMETPEVAAVTEQILTRFWPDVFVDAHNGGSLPYHMTYQATLDPTADQDLVDFARGPMYESIKARLESQGMQMYWYSGPGFDQQSETWFWRTTVPWVRKQHSYGGIQNMITLLYEVPGGHSLDVQAAAARESMLGLIQFVADNAEETRRIVQEARRRTVEEPAAEIILTTQESVYPELEEFQIRERNPDGSWGEFRTVMGENRTLWIPENTRRMPGWGYAFDARLDDVAAFLRRHGIQVEQLREETTMQVERFRIEDISWASSPYQNHLLAQAEVEVVPGELTFPAGTYVVRLGQVTGRLIPLLMEPDAEDSVLRWNFLDHSIPSSGGANAWVPIYRLDAAPGVPLRVTR
jgi:dipeptidyl-peptidase 4